jgi:hypothetical protein
MTFKEILSALAIAATFAIFIPYILSIHRGTTRPHVFSWIIWGLGTFVVFLAQVAANAGVGAWPTAVSGVLTAYVAVAAYLKHADRGITRTDWIFLVFALAALPCWYFTSDPLWAVLILTGVDMAGFAPTFRKSWVHPNDEPVGLYLLSVPRNILAILALEEYSLTTLLFPAAVAIACFVFVLMVVYRRRAIVMETEIVRD